MSTKPNFFDKLGVLFRRSDIRLVMLARMAPRGRPVTSMHLCSLKGTHESTGTQQPLEGNLGNFRMRPIVFHASDVTALKKCGFRTHPRHVEERHKTQLKDQLKLGGKGQRSGLSLWVGVLPVCYGSKTTIKNSCAIISVFVCSEPKSIFYLHNEDALAGPHSFKGQFQTY